MRSITLLLLAITFLSAHQEAKNPFLNLKFDKVVMYDFEGGKGSDLAIINDKGQLAKSVNKQVQLDVNATKKLTNKLGEKKSYGSVTAFCFDPHVGFVYYFKNKVVAHVSVCLDCNRLKSSVDIPAQKQGQVGKGDEAYFIANGLSKSFRQFINSLLRKENFSHQIKPGSSFD